MDENLGALIGDITGIVLSQSVCTITELGVPDLLADGPRSIADLAKETGTQEQQLNRMMRFLTANGVFEHQDGQYSLTPKGNYLRRDVLGSQHYGARMMHFMARTWSEMGHSLRTAESSFSKAYGKPVFDYLGERPDEAAIFDAAMVSFHGAETGAVLDAYDYSGIGTLADIGGGNGSVLTATLEKNPELRGHWFDLPHVEAGAKEAFQAAGVSDRCDMTTGNFFEEVPAGADAYQMRHIIHDWYDDKAGVILENVRKVIPSDGKLLLIETVVGTDNAPEPAKLFDMIMLAIPGGLERTEAEFRELYKNAGFELTSITRTPTPACVIEGRPI